MNMTPMTLEDVQRSVDTRGIAIQQVGVKQVDLPLNILQKDGHPQRVAASVSLSVKLPAEAKGSHLSRFMIQLAHYYQNHAFCYDLKNFLEDTQERLETDAAYLKMDFRYFIEKKAPVTDYQAPMAYPCRFEASLEAGQPYQFVLGVEIPIATLCPCSKAISEYGAHNQRAIIHARMALSMADDHQVLWIEDLIDKLEECGSCPVYPILKREDEKYVTERAYDNPKFVEDVIRDCILVLRGLPIVQGFELNIEAFESIHGHNAWASHREGQSVETQPLC